MIYLFQGHSHLISEKRKKADHLPGNSFGSCRGWASDIVLTPESICVRLGPSPAVCSSSSSSGLQPGALSLCRSCFPAQQLCLSTASARPTAPVSTPSSNQPRTCRFSVAELWDVASARPQCQGSCWGSRAVPAWQGWNQSPGRAAKAGPSAQGRRGSGAGLGGTNHGKISTKDTPPW